MQEKHVETIAVYREERVKVYGITEKADLALIILRFPAASAELWGLRIIELEKFLKRFELVTCHAGSHNTIELHLLFDRKDSSALHRSINAVIKNEEKTEVILKQPVDILFLFGPHFQDRFGIVDIAFSALRDSRIDILVSGCAGTSMYFVTSEKQGRKGLQVLTDTFLIPTTISPQRPQ